MLARSTISEKRLKGEKLKKKMYSSRPLKIKVIITFSNKRLRIKETSSL